MKIPFIVLSVSVLILMAGCTKKENKNAETGTPAVPPSGVYISKIIECLDHSMTVIDSMKTPADAAASRIVKGGKIYVTDDETITRTGKEKTKMIPGGGFNYPMNEDWGGLVAEACDRAGGFRQIQPVPVNGKLSRNDVVLAGTLELHPEEQAKQLQSLRDSGALVILFGSEKSKSAASADYVISNGLEPGINPVMNVGGTELVGPVAGIANVVNMWAFSSELVAALTRQGKMPTMWQSMFVPGAAPRNEKIGKDFFDKNMKIIPVESGVLGRQYVTAVKGFLEEINLNELDKFKEAGTLCSQTISGGGKIVASIIGHFMTSQRRMPGFPSFLTIKENEYGADQLKGVLTGTDLWLHIGYSYYPERELKFAKEAGAKTICVFTPGPTEVGEGSPVQPDMSLIGVYIDPYWKHGDAVVEVPGYDTKIIPPSGVVQATCYWMIIGETMSGLAQLKK